MQFQFRGFRATRPVVRLIDTERHLYEVFFIVYDELGKKRSIRYKRGINKLPLSKRKAEAQEIAFSFWDALHQNWNPLVHKTPFFAEEHAQARQLRFTEAIDYCLKVKSSMLRKGSHQVYRSKMRFVKKASVKAGMDQVPIGLVERKDIRVIIDIAREDNGWTPRERNQVLTVLRSLFSVLIDEERIKYNPTTGIRKDREPEPEGYKRLTDEQMKTIGEHLAAKVPAYFEFTQFVYQVGVRPGELLAIKIENINLRRREITVPKEVSKTKKKRIVPITDDLMEILMGRGVHDLPGHWYLFSKNEFSPGPRKYWHSTGGRWWTKYVTNDLGIDCKLYSFKHKGTDDKILADIPLEALQSLYGHSSTQMTERYASKLKEKHNKQIIASAPSFAKVVQMKKAK
jgi:integrase